MKLAIEQLIYTDPLYPVQLSSIADPPKKINFVGDIGLLKKHCIAVVGTRHPTSYSSFLVSKYISRLFECDKKLVSGFVSGVDMLVHQYGLDYDKPTICVLGYGLNQLYKNPKVPALLDSGCLFISEYENDFAGRKWSFSRRNRIIAATGSCLILLEAGVRSGSLITASYAHKLGKPIYCFSFSLESQSSLGLVTAVEKYCAKVILSPETFDQALDLQNSVNTGLTSITGDSQDPQDLLFQLLTTGPRTLDEILSHTNIKITNLNLYLINLILSKKIYKKNDKYYVANY